MSEKEKWAIRLNDLWQKNFQVANYYRRAMEAVTDNTVKRSLLKYATKRAQFAFELGSKIKALGGKPSYSRASIPSGRDRTISLNLPDENLERIIKKCLKTEKTSIKEYKKALSCINDGGSREILLRHISLAQVSIKELKNLKAAGSYLRTDENVKTK